MLWGGKSLVGVLCIEHNILKFPFSYFTLTKGWCSKRQPLNSLRWPIYVVNSVDNTKLPHFRMSLIEAWMVGNLNDWKALEINKLQRQNKLRNYVFVKNAHYVMMKTFHRHKKWNIVTNPCCCRLNVNIIFQGFQNFLRL